MRAWVAYGLVWLVIAVLIWWLVLAVQIPLRLAN
jgi:hypothetical protein